MQQRDRLFLAVIFAALIVGAFLVSVKSPPGDEPEPLPVRQVILPEVLPDFGEIRDTPTRKQAFFDFVRPFVEYQNERILDERARVLNWQEQLQRSARLTPAQRRAMQRLARHYRIDPEDLGEAETLALLLRRADVIPVSLALSQSANESAWGTSRFAVQGNNLFGQWCFREGCGMVPERRASGAIHEVAAFESPLRSVQSYMHNLNTHPAYKPFRELRERLRDEERSLTGLDLAEGLLRYSTRGEDYVRELQAMIRVNELQRFDS